MLGLKQTSNPSTVTTGFTYPGLIAAGVLLAVLVPLVLTLPSGGGEQAPPARPVSRVVVDGAAYSVSKLAPLLPAPRPAIPGFGVLTPQAPGPPISPLFQAQPQVNPTGPQIMALEQRLSTLGYMVGKVDGTLDRATSHGIMAFQKVEGLPRTGKIDAPMLQRLDSATTPTPKFSTPPDHLEVDIPRQVVFVVRGGKVSAILPTATGNNKRFTSEGYTRRAFTPNGTFTIAYKRNGWRKSPLGMLYRPAYFNGGIAFHGAHSVPAQPASHGCVRLPMAFADWFADHASAVGTVVYVYGGPAGENPAPVFTDTASPGVPGAPAPPAAAPGPAPAPVAPVAPPPPPPAPPPPPPPLGGVLGPLLSQ